MIDARDGEQDTIDCGVGEDRATVDAIDVVTNCEQVDKSGGGTQGSDGSLNGPKRYSRKALRRASRSRSTARRPAPSRLTLTADKKTARRLGTKLIVSGKGSIARAGTVKFRARLTPKARKRLGRLKQGRGTVAAVVTEGGATKRYTQVVKLKR